MPSGTESGSNVTSGTPSQTGEQECVSLRTRAFGISVGVVVGVYVAVKVFGDLIAMEGRRHAHRLGSLTNRPPGIRLIIPDPGDDAAESA